MAKKILVIEDNDRICTCSAVCSKPTAGDPRGGRRPTGIEMAKTLNPAAILLDIQLP